MELTFNLLSLGSSCPSSLTSMPPGPSAFLISENRPGALLAKVSWLLFQKLVLGCREDTRGEKAPGQASGPSRKSAVHDFHGEKATKMCSDRTTKWG